MKQIKKRLLVLSFSAMMVMAMCVSAFAAGEDSSGTSGASATVISAFQTAFQSMAADAKQMIAIIVPIAVGLAGVLWLARKAMGWFKSMGK